MYINLGISMNRQFSFLTCTLLATLLFCFAGCDLGTYNKRFNERDKPVTKKPAEEDKSSVEEAGSADSE